MDKPITPWSRVLPKIQAWLRTKGYVPPEEAKTGKLTWGKRDADVTSCIVCGGRHFPENCVVIWTCDAAGREYLGEQKTALMRSKSSVGHLFYIGPSTAASADYDAPDPFYGALPEFCLACVSEHDVSFDLEASVFAVLADSHDPARNDGTVTVSQVIAILDDINTCAENLQNISER